jgi:hypothetical protein
LLLLFSVLLDFAVDWLSASHFDRPAALVLAHLMRSGHDADQIVADRILEVIVL